jgi:U4/U6.U5 tri-snRNP component SNU23
LGQNDYRRKWDKEEYLAKSKAQDAAAQEYAQAAQAAQAAGKKPPPRPRAGDANMGPKPTKALEAREEDLRIEKNLGKSMLIAAGGKGPGAGFYVSDSISSGEGQVASWERVTE